MTKNRNPSIGGLFRPKVAEKARQCLRSTFFRQELAQ